MAIDNRSILYAAHNFDNVISCPGSCSSCEMTRHATCTGAYFGVIALIQVEVSEVSTSGRSSSGRGPTAAGIGVYHYSPGRRGLIHFKVESVSLGGGHHSLRTTTLERSTHCTQSVGFPPCGLLRGLRTASHAWLDDVPHKWAKRNQVFPTRVDRYVDSLVSFSSGNYITDYFVSVTI